MRVCWAFTLMFASSVWAAPDAFHLGDGHSGSRIVFTPEIVNVYSALAQDIAAGAAGMEVMDGSLFTVGDLVLVLNSAGGIAAASGDGADVMADALALGAWELARVQAVQGNTLLLSGPFTRAFPALGTQAVTVP